MSVATIGVQCRSDGHVFLKNPRPFESVEWIENASYTFIEGSVMPTESTCAVVLCVKIFDKSHSTDTDRSFPDEISWPLTSFEARCSLIHPGDLHSESDWHLPVMN